jgi:hypothetical protein
VRYQSCLAEREVLRRWRMILGRSCEERDCVDEGVLVDGMELV